MKLRRHPSSIALALLLAVGVALGLLAASRFGSVAGGDAPAGTDGPPGFTLSSTAWTLDELLGSAESGELSAIGVMSPPSTPGSSPGSPILVARTSTGELRPVRLTVPMVDGLAAIRAAGFSALLTDEAIAAGAAAASSGDDRLVVGLGLSIAVMAAMGLYVVRGRRSGRASWRPTRVRARGRRRGEAERGDRPTVSLADVAGADEAKVELTETIEFLRDPARFSRLGAKAVRGVMLYGPPGTGKTLLAKAVAAEADVPFYSVSGSEFVEKFVGVGAGRVRELFAKARTAGRGVIFIDEIDALAKSRGGSNSHDEREQTLNQLLVEMDGFDTTDEIVVIGATNRLDTLDPAILRPGRFTRKIHVPLPDRDGRLAILQVHAANKPIAPDVDLPTVARKTYGFSGAMLADLLNEAAILAARSGLDEIGPEEVHAGWLKTALGTSRKRSMDDRERSIIAAHEAGHAVCGFIHGDKRRVEEISLFAHGDALGVTVSSSEDNDLPSETDLRARLVALMGGRVAEELLFSEVTGGASNDFEKATSIASTMVVRYGMGHDPEATAGGITGRGILTTLVGSDSEGIDGDVRDARARAIRGILDDAYATARRTLLIEMARLRAVSAYLYEQERIDGEAFEALMAGRLEPVDGEGWRAAAAAPRPWETIPELFTERPAEPVVVVAPPPSIRPVSLPASSPASAATTRRVPPAGRTPRRRFRRHPIGLGLPGMPVRLRRTLAAIVRDLAAEER
ncbi:MAG TPA: AAA family ATPase [Candidatus Saccharimonadales bacterium]|nr:AAA family ATPase [Candidatus Saccharimonadales bacterium]